VAVLLLRFDFVEFVGEWDAGGLDVDGAGAPSAPDVAALGEALAVQPGHLVPDLEPRVLKPGGQPVVGPGAAEGEEMAARL